MLFSLDIISELLNYLFLKKRSTLNSIGSTTAFRCFSRTLETKTCYVSFNNRGGGGAGHVGIEEGVQQS